MVLALPRVAILRLRLSTSFVFFVYFLLLCPHEQRETCLDWRPQRVEVHAGSFLGLRAKMPHVHGSVSTADGAERAATQERGYNVLGRVTSHGEEIQDFRRAFWGHVTICSGDQG